MARKHYLVGGAAALVAAAVITGCQDSKQIMKQEAVDPLFQNYAALGNSVTAGYQSGGINDSTQKQSYAVLFAQAAGTRFAIPAIAMPGCPPPIDNFLTLHRVTPPGYPVSMSTSCYARDPGSVTPVVNNEAVPGAASIDPDEPDHREFERAHDVHPGRLDPGRARADGEPDVRVGVDRQQ